MHNFERACACILFTTTAFKYCVSVTREQYPAADKGQFAGPRQTVGYDVPWPQHQRGADLYILYLAACNSPAAIPCVCSRADLHCSGCSWRLALAVQAAAQPNFL